MQELKKGKNLDSLRGDYSEPLFVKNPLFFHFCLWFLYHSGAYFDFGNMDQECDVLQKYILHKLDTRSLIFQDIVRRYPAINIEEILEKKDKLRSQFFGNILSKCHNVRTLQLESSNSLDWVLKSVRQVLPCINYIAVRNLFVMSRVQDVLTFVYKNQRNSNMVTQLELSKMFWKHLIYFGTDLSARIYGFENCDALFFILQLNHPNTTQVSVYGRHQMVQTQTIRKAMPQFVYLKQLSLASLEFDEEGLSYLSEAMEAGKLPYLTSLSFMACHGLESNLSKLFSSPWPQLTHLGFHDCGLSISDLQVIGNMDDDRFPDPSSMALSFNLSEVTQKRSTEYLKKRLAIQKTLYLDAPNVVDEVSWKPTKGLTILHLREQFLQRESPYALLDLPPFPEILILHRCVSMKTLAQTLHRDKLKHLDISSSSITGSLSVLLHHSFPSLNSLILHRLALNLQDLRSLAKASVGDRLPELRYLDISGNKLDSSEAVNSLFDHSCTWNELIGLNIMDTEFSQSKLHKRVESGFLSSLQELRISNYPYEAVNITWPTLQILGTKNPSKMMLDNVADAVVEYRLPALRKVCLEFESYPPETDLHTFESFHRLSEAKISCHVFTCRDEFFVKSKCICQQS